MDGPPRGRELEIADLLSFIKHAGVRNTVWMTADVHYTAAHYYDPNKAAFQDFEPFWEFVSGPLHAGSLGPNELDKTFGPQLMYRRRRPRSRARICRRLRVAVFRPRGDRRRERRDDGDAQGHGGSCAVVDQPRTEVTAVSGVRRCGRCLTSSWPAAHGPAPTERTPTSPRRRRPGCGSASSSCSIHRP